LSAPERRPAVLRGVDLGRWVPAPEVCRQWLQDLLAAEVASLKLLEEALRRGKEGAAHDRVMRMAKMMPEGDMSRQYLRYRKEADSRYLRSHRALLATLEHDAARMADDEDDGSDEGAGAGTTPTVTTEPAAAAEALTADKVDSPIEPGNGRTPTTPTVAPTGGNGLFVLLLLAILLGQLFAGLGRARAWAAALASERPRATSSSLVECVSTVQPTIPGAFAVACAAPTHPPATAPDLERRDR
jgi:hypothetical protein